MSGRFDLGASDLDDSRTLQCVSLAHPRHGKPARFLHTNNKIWEINRVYQPPSSWIMQHEIQEDGSFYMCTPIDPLFLALPLLERGRKKVRGRGKCERPGDDRCYERFNLMAHCVFSLRVTRIPVSVMFCISDSRPITKAASCSWISSFLRAIFLCAFSVLVVRLAPPPSVSCATCVMAGPSRWCDCRMRSHSRGCEQKSKG